MLYVAHWRVRLPAVDADRRRAVDEQSSLLDQKRMLAAQVTATATASRRVASLGMQPHGVPPAGVSTLA